MKEHCRNIYQTARRTAGSTQEHWAEQIDDFREDGMRKLLRIAADGKVDDNEIASYEDAMQQLTMLVEQALALGFAK